MGRRASQLVYATNNCLILAVSSSISPTLSFCTDSFYFEQNSAKCEFV